MKRIVWISCVGEKGGSEVTMLNTFRVLDRRKYRPGVILLRPGPLEAALVGAPVPDPGHPAAIAHVVKSFDPCLFCTVH